MPQLDYLTYTSQIFWFLIFFCLLYLRVVVTFLPKIAQIQKIRYKTKKADAQHIILLNEKAQATTVQFEKLLRKNFKVTHDEILQQKVIYDKETDSILTKIQKNQLKTSNQDYITTIINLNLSKFIITKAIQT